MSSERKSHAGTRLRRTLSMAFQSPLRKRQSVVRPPTPPTCEERIHYPVFNSRDPRHNPEAASFSDFDLPEGSQGTEKRKGSFPRRSLRKMQSGLLALKSGMQRRPREQKNTRHSLPASLVPVPQNVNRGSSDHQGESLPLMISEVSTENDHGFGTDLYRTVGNGGNGSSVEEPVNARTCVIGAAITHESAVGLPELDVGSNGVRLDGETLHEQSEEEAADGNILDPETTGEESKRPSITWDEGHLNRVASSHSNSGYIDSSSTETSSSSEESSDSRIITDANEALDALCLLDPSTEDRDSGPNIGASAGFYRDIREGTSAPDSPTLPSEVPARLRLDAEHSTIAGDDQAEPKAQANEIDTVEELEQAGVRDTKESGQDEQLHSAEKAKETELVSHTEPEEVTTETAEGKRNGNSFLQLVPTEIIAKPLEFPENITDSSSVQYTESRYSASLSNGNTSTPPISTRLSVDISYPFEYDDVVTLPSLNIGDEYMYDDGKHNTFSPDQDRTPIKSDSMILRQGSVDTVPSIDRALSMTMRNHSPQIVCPGSIYQQPSRQSQRAQNRLQRSRGASDSEDGYLTYSMFQRQYG